ncbi:hypothetical protein C0J52_22489 [Blattella germanica]|nr:hypothetical protein C0J52_22489 [Blattella germanica]
MVCFLMSLVDTGRMSKVVYRLPMRGHSFLPNDRDFGIVKRRRNKVDRYYTVRDVMEIIANANNKFRVRLVKTEEILDFQTWYPTVYKKSPVSEESHVGRKNATKGKREVFAIPSYHEFIWKKERKGWVQALPCIGGLETKHFQFAFGAQISLPNYVAYTR